ncbi:MAG TPA: ABC transporter permease [Oscillatoriaceae cyanobacterium]
MNFFQTLRIALKALWLNRMRSFLTALGVIIGVAAVVAMVAMGQGAKARVQQAFASMGTNMLIILPGSTSAGGARGGFGSRMTLTWDDLKAIQTQCPAVRYATVSLHSNAQVASEDENWMTSVYGTEPAFFSIRDWGVSLGSLFSASDLPGDAKVAVLGQTVVDQLWGAGINPVGQTVRIKNVPFEVVGVLASKGQSAMGQDYDDAVYVPATTFQAEIQGGLQQYISGQVLVSAVSADETQPAIDQITALLRDRHHLQAQDDDDFSIRNLAEIESASQQGTQTLSMLLAGIAAVSLLVGGIGIMNIMLVSVTERTREIGLRMAVGAKPKHVLMQFLLEATTLSVAGGLIGLLLGSLIAQRLASQFGWPMVVEPGIMLIAVGFSALVGIGFGLYPALKASRLDPIDALRYE